MRIFSSAVQAVREIEREVTEFGFRVKTKTYQDKDISMDPGFDSKELVGYSFMLHNGDDWQDTFTALGMEDSEDCINYVDRETTARLHRPAGAMNPGRAWKERQDTWRGFLEGDGRFSYTYPERIHDGETGYVYKDARESQISKIRRLHENDPGSRQLIIDIWDRHQDPYRSGGARRVPCTIYYQIIDRGNGFYLIHNMRSLDLYTHLAVDLSISWKMAVGLARGLQSASPPRVIMQTGSLHAFHKDIERRRAF